MLVLHLLRCLAYGLIALLYLGIALGVSNPYLYLVLSISYAALFCVELRGLWD